MERSSQLLTRRYSFCPWNCRLYIDTWYCEQWWRSNWLYRSKFNKLNDVEAGHTLFTIFYNALSRLSVFCDPNHLPIVINHYIDVRKGIPRRGRKLPQFNHAERLFHSALNLARPLPDSLHRCWYLFACFRPGEQFHAQSKEYQVGEAIN